MKVILRQDVAELGKRGETYEVAPGYFRNFLQPRGMAVEATKGALKTQALRVSSTSVKKAREVDQTSQIAQELAELTLTFPVKVGEQGRMYGSVTAKDIAEELQKQRGATFDRHKIILEEPLRSTGEHRVTLKLEHGVEAHIQVDLVAESET